MSDPVVSAKEWAEAYRGLLAVGRLVCAVEDRHKGRWWPYYAVRALRHRDNGQGVCRQGFRGRRCDDCQRASREGWL